VRGYLTQLRYFFDTIVSFTQNNPLREALGKLTEQSEPLRYNLLKHGFSQPRPTGYTDDIIDALARRDFSRAADIKRAHIMTNLPRVLKAYADSIYEGSPPTALRAAPSGGDA
jgi:DNA-binding GntR family transcriptional regulator